MACEFEVLLNQHQYDQGPDAAVEVLDQIVDLERKLSVYKPSSDFSRLNASDQPVAVSDDAMTVLRLAKFLNQETQGAFDITAGTLSDVWGFSRRQGRLPTQEDIEQALNLVGSRHLELEPASGDAFMQVPGVKVNPGGIGKGYALDRAGQILSEAGVQDYMMHGGSSSISASGDRKHVDCEAGWIVALKHPFQEERTLGTVRLLDQSLATSGSGKQFFHFRGKRYSHIIDPRSGHPAQGILSTTVVYPSAAIADALATAFFILGVEGVEEFCGRHGEVGAILVYRDENRGGRETVATFNLPKGVWSIA